MEDKRTSLLETYLEEQGGDGEQKDEMLNLAIKFLMLTGSSRALTKEKKQVYETLQALVNGETDLTKLHGPTVALINHTMEELDREVANDEIDKASFKAMLEKDQQQQQ